MRGANTTIAISRATTGELDGRNRPTKTWSVVAPLVVANLAVKTKRTVVIGGVADFGDGGMTVEDVRLLVPPTTDLRPGDRVTHDGETFTVHAVTSRRTHTGATRHLNATLERTSLRPTPSPTPEAP